MGNTLRKFISNNYDKLAINNLNPRVKAFLTDYIRSPLAGGAKGDTDKTETKKSAFNAWRELIRWESTIKDSFMFWICFGEIYQSCEFTSFFPDEVEKMIQRFDRRGSKGSSSHTYTLQCRHSSRRDCVSSPSTLLGSTW